MALHQLPLLMQLLVNNEERNDLRNSRKFLRDHSDPLHLPENVFGGLYRLRRQTAHYLINEIVPHMNDITREEIAIPKPLKIFITLHLLAQGSYQKGCGQDYNFPMCQASVSNCVREVCTVINNFLSYKIHFPTTEEEKEVVKMGFFNQRNGFPGIIGAIDCTQVAIIAPPTMNENHPGILFLNRKGYYSLNVQIIVDAELKILAINARYPGSVHDSAIWTTSAVRQHLQVNHNNGDRTSWLIGDSGYPLEPWLMTPILGNNLQNNELQYNIAHKSLRNVIERLNGVLKGRFRCVLKHRTLHYDPETAGKIINACAILHNICVELNDDFEIDENEYQDGPEEDEVHVGGQQRQLLNEGNRIRDRIVADYF